MELPCFRQWQSDAGIKDVTNGGTKMYKITVDMCCELQCIGSADICQLNSGHKEKYFALQYVSSNVVMSAVAGNNGHTAKNNKYF